VFQVSGAVEYRWYATCPTMFMSHRTSVGVELSSLYLLFFFALGKNCFKRAMGLCVKCRNLRYPSTFIVLIFSAFRRCGHHSFTSWIYNFPFAQPICTFTLVILRSALVAIGSYLNRVGWQFKKQADRRPETFPGLQLPTTTIIIC